MKRTLAHLVAPPSDYRQNFAAISSPAVMTTLMFSLKDMPSKAKTADLEAQASFALEGGSRRLGVELLGIGAWADSTRPKKRWAYGAPKRFQERRLLRSA
ncbi:hypothetical protein [Bradyrhizobium guangdongense]